MAYCGGPTTVRTACLYYLLQLSHDAELLSRLTAPSKFHRILNRTKKYQSSCPMHKPIISSFCLFFSMYMYMYVFCFLFICTHALLSLLFSRVIIVLSLLCCRSFNLVALAATTIHTSNNHIPSG